MKNKIKELNVDFIGGQNSPLTKEEEKSYQRFHSFKEGKA